MRALRHARRLNVAPAVRAQVLQQQRRRIPSCFYIASPPPSRGLSAAAAASSSAAKAPKSPTDMYQRKTPVEHVLLRPDTYVGSTQWTNEPAWVVQHRGAAEAAGGEEEGGGGGSRGGTGGAKMLRTDCRFVPGLYKIFDEILVNASDNLRRDPSMNVLSVDIDRERGEISVLNNGRGIPVARHETENMYVPELVLGNLLTGSNFDDSEAKVTGGRNGFGAKLTNIFSKRMAVETVDSERGLKYAQVWSENMSVCEPPVITELDTAARKVGDYTRVTFQPDLEKFGMQTLEDGDFLRLAERRVFDMAGCLSTVEVSLDGVPCDMDFKGYLEMYPVGATDSGVIGTRAFKRVNDRWTVALGVSTTGQFEQVSFVNGIATTKGGTHVSYILDQVVNFIIEQLGKKYKDMIVTPAQVRAHLFVAVDALIENPSFTSQIKEFLTTKPSRFGSLCRLPKSFINDFVVDSGALDYIASWVRAREQIELSATATSQRKGRVTGIPKLYDAAWAGGPRASECTLILTEGDSAKALAVAGLSTLGRHQYGVFPLRGKPLNVRDAAHKQLVENVELNHVKTILGLSHDREYHTEEDLATLRYGRVMLMTDQDHDGSHIKGLMINFFHKFWPTLLRNSSFLEEFVTPIVKVTKSGNTRSFFTIPEYEEWVESMGGNLSGYKIKYYKGLGTNTAQEAKEYFGDLDTHKLRFTWEDEPDSGDLIDMAFSKSTVERRKSWLLNLQPGTHVDHSKEELSLSDFINHELILFSHVDNVRSIPSVIDGLKPGQRKVLYACFKRRLHSEMKVAQLAGYVAEHTAYHHGEMSLHGTIINMAQDFVGSNNLPLLAPVGQFGTRLQGGKDSASGRYLFTHLSALARQIFPETDDILMDAQQEDNQDIEPHFYCPIIPLVLVNGARGLGTGWSTQVQPHHPLEVIDNVLNLVRGESMTPMVPWVRGFAGKILQDKKSRVRSVGVARKVDAATIEITELPVGVWTDDYKEFLDLLVRPKFGAKPVIKGYDEAHTENAVRFVLRLTPRQMTQAERLGFNKVFKLERSMNSTNMMLFGRNGLIKHYDSAESIIRDFFVTREQLYAKRKNYLVEKLKREVLRLDSKVKFTDLISSRKLEVVHQPRAAIEGVMKSEGLPELTLRESSAEAAIQAINSGESAKVLVEEPVSYEYLLRTPVLHLTEERQRALAHEARRKREELDALAKKSGNDMWEEDLLTLRSTVARMLKKDKKK